MVRSLAVTILVVLLFASCTEKVDIELDTTYTRLVVYGEITTEAKTHSIELKKSADYFFNKPAEVVTDANVEISWEDTTIFLTESTNRPGIYETGPDFRGKVGKTYSLRIDDVDINNDGESEEYTASSYLPPANPVDSITFQYTSTSFFKILEIKVWALDPVGIKNYYLFKALVNNKLISDTLTEITAQNDDFFDGNYTNGITSQVLDMTDPGEKVQAGDTVTFELNGITEEFYNFILEAQSESFGQNPLFSGPPANIRSNISNDALGFFTAYSVSRSSRIVGARDLVENN